ncbi:MAG: NAD(P)H-hydrate epimerase [bacterium]
MFALYGSDMRILDSLAVKRCMIPPMILMENAAAASVNALSSKWSFSSSVVICGDGNNGGDGFAAARHLFNRGVETRVVLLGKKKRFSNETSLNYRILKKMEIDIIENPSPALFKNILSYADIIVDAIYGIGYRGELNPVMRRYFKAVNSSKKRVISLDIPSGIDSDTGEFDTDCISSDMTVTFGAVKTGLLWKNAAKKSKELLIADISIPRNIIFKVKNFIIVEKDFLSLMADSEKNKKERWVHKTERGKASFIGGSDGMEGSIQLASEAALKTGAGIVYTYMISSAKKRFFPEIVFSGRLSDALKKSDVWIVGCGMATKPESFKILEEINKKRSGGIVLYDADALNMISKLSRKDKKAYLCNTIITPHPEEFYRLSGKRFSNIKEKIQATEEFSKEFETLVVLKSPPTVITDSKTTMIFPNMSEKLATAGSGDILAGIIGGFLSQGYSPMTASALGVFVHFYSGFNSISESPTASQFLENISKSKKEVLNA